MSNMLIKKTLKSKKPKFQLNVLKYIEIETFEADGTVKEVKKWVKCLEQKALLEIQR